MIISTTSKCYYAGDVLQNPVITGEPFFVSQVFKKSYHIAAMFKYGHRFVNSDSKNEWFQLLSRFRDSSVSSDDINAFHALIGGVLFPYTNHDVNESKRLTVYRSLTSRANTIVMSDSKKKHTHNYLQPHRLQSIIDYCNVRLRLGLPSIDSWQNSHRNAVMPASIPQDEIASFPFSSSEEKIVILCSERSQRNAYNDLAKIKQDVDKNSCQSSNFISIATDVFHYINGATVPYLYPDSTISKATQDHTPLMQDFPPKELHLKVGMCVSIANNSVDHYWVNNMKVNMKLTFSIHHTRFVHFNSLFYFKYETNPNPNILPCRLKLWRLEVMRVKLFAEVSILQAEVENIPL